jgi:hypothetical protein
MLMSALGKTSSANTLFSLQKPYVDNHVRPDCVVGAGQSGTLGYFRDRVVNLDGKVNPAALAAAESRRLVDYVAKESNVDVFVDWQFYVDSMIGPTQVYFHPVESFGQFKVWVRHGRESCLLANDAESASLPRAPSSR